MSTVGGVVVLALLAGAPAAVAAPPDGVPVVPPPTCVPGAPLRPAQPAPAARGLLAALLGAVAGAPAPAPAAPAPAPAPPVAPACPATPGRSAGDATSAAVLRGWGTPTRVDEFGGTALGSRWNVYDGPGHAGKGRRTPKAVAVRNGILTITGDSRGNTAGMEWSGGQRYGRWEGRVRAPASDESYDALLLLWPDAENFPVGGEIDFMEMMDHTRQQTHVFLHYGKKNRQLSGKVAADATQWHNWAVEWTPTHITTFLDGRPWWSTDRVDTFPPGKMHLCIQLDWFPGSGRGTVTPSMMQVDWVKQYALRPSERQPA